MFTATQAGFKDGLGGASNSEAIERRRYVLFGIQRDPQHAENSGIYFEYDDQSKGAVNCVQAVLIGDESVTFELKTGGSIKVNCRVTVEEWGDLQRGIHSVFPPNIIASTGPQ